MEPSAVSFACYLFGETKDPSAMETLLKLTYDDNIRVRSSALNALGKISIDALEKDFREKVSQRLIELVNEDQSYKLFNKDLAFAFRNYFGEHNISSLVKLLSFDFFGVRFLAADALKSYYKNENDIINVMQSVSNSFVIPAEAGIQKAAYQAFMMSLTDLKDDLFIKIYDNLYNYCSKEEILKMNLLDLLKQREKKATGENREFYIQKIKLLQESISLKVK
jgi:hypothetical protein